MGRFLATYNGVATEEQKQELSAEQQQQLMMAWGQWAAAHKGALADPGAPLFRKRRVTSTGSSVHLSPLSPAGGYRCTRTA